MLVKRFRGYIQRIGLEEGSLYDKLARGIALSIK